ncbi:MAG: helix-turn-helix protein [Microvirga sp.]|jgi:IclR family mhp operon transcriptional activator|nr:helix-turn-helix protein [Microvirga sp.]
MEGLRHSEATDAADQTTSERSGNNIATRVEKQPQQRCRTNSRRGLSDPGRRSYPPVESVRRALEILRAVNRLRIASVTAIHAATHLPKPTIIRMLETLMADGYVARDNMFGGYRVTCRVHELTKGYDGISMVIEASRAPAIELTQRIKWPIGIGVLDGDAISIQFWTGAISPWAHTNTVLGLRPTLVSSAMGRAYMAYCPDDEREKILAGLRADPRHKFDAEKETEFRQLLARLRSTGSAGFAVRDPRTEPKQMTTLAMPLTFDNRVLAAISVSFYKSAVPLQNISNQIVAPLTETRNKIEENLALLMRGPGAPVVAAEHLPDGLAPLSPG